jgi:hypothetical protein
MRPCTSWREPARCQARWRKEIRRGRTVAARVLSGNAGAKKRISASDRSQTSRSKFRTNGKAEPADSREPMGEGSVPDGTGGGRTWHQAVGHPRVNRRKARTKNIPARLRFACHLPPATWRLPQSRYFANSSLAINARCTSSGPSAIRRVRIVANISARGKSGETPAPPCI